MSDERPSDQPVSELDAELERLAPEPLQLRVVDPETGRDLSRIVFRDHLARAQLERDERPQLSCPRTL